jgi:dihydrofolate synthase / folylpolyglutamate synthase
MSISNLGDNNNQNHNERTLEEWLNWQEKLHFTAIELGLERCRRVAENMQLLLPNYFVISIAGTNGKGSCAVLLDTILREAGFKTGLYSSPHLLRYNERIKINGQELPDEMLCNAFSKINRARDKISLTYFEFGTLAAMDIFAENNIDIAIMEVGMGGRLDAVNMLDANIAIISTIDIDHQQWLGETRDEIAKEKAGIFRPMRPAICGDLNTPATIINVAEHLGTNLLQMGKDFHYEVSDRFWSWRSGFTQYQELPIPGNGDFQIQNASTVLMALTTMQEKFPVSPEAILNGLENFSMPGRFHVIDGEFTLVIDVAHNSQSARVLKNNLIKMSHNRRVLLIIAMLNDKCHEKFISELLPCANILCISGLGGGRGASAKALESAIHAHDIDTQVMVFDKLNDAFAWANSEATSKDIVAITGSFITVGMAMKYFNIEY